MNWGRRAIPKSTVRPNGVVVLSPPLDEHNGLEQRVERFPLWPALGILIQSV